MKKTSHNYVILFSILLAVFLGAVARFYPVLLSHYPINDGGLFYQMSQDILDHNFALPFHTSYNSEDIPFGYPPIPFYLLALIQRFLHIALLDQLHYLPALISTLCIPAFYFLSRSITGSKERSVFAVFAYALIPGSYSWLIMGGGISRALGILLAILSLCFVWEMFKNTKVSWLLLSIFSCSLLVLSHPGITWFVFVTSLLISLQIGLNKKRILYAILTALGILVLTSPWWIITLRRFGFSLFVDAVKSSGPINPSVILFNFTGEPFITIIAVVALLGLFAEIVRRRYFLLIWLILIAFVTPRGSLRLAAIPGSMLFASGVVWVIVPGLTSFTKRVSEDSQQLGEIMREGISKVALAIILFAAFFSALAFPLLGSPETKSLSQSDVQAMQWVSQNTLLNSRFALLTGEEQWITDPITEWFPAFAKRNSVATIQGSEWLPDQTYKKRIDSYYALQDCSEQDYSCVATWAKDNNISYSYLYVTRPASGEKGINLPINYSLVTSDELQLSFENQGVRIYRVVDPP